MLYRVLESNYTETLLSPSILHVCLPTQVSNMVQCPLDPGHWMPEGSLQEHIVKCRLNKEGIDFSAYVRLP